MTYPAPALFIDGEWRATAASGSRLIRNPATEEVLGNLPEASTVDVDDALSAATKGFELWRGTLPSQRAQVLTTAARLIADRTPQIARLLTLEQGKPLNESRLELARVVETFSWHGAQAARIHGTIHSAKASHLRQFSQPEPIGVVAAFSAWNFPAVLPARKLAPALAAGCSVILKPAEETPATAMAIVQALADSGLPPGVVNLLLGDPEFISTRLTASSVVRKVTFTGSVAVGKQLARLASNNLQRCTLELGGHSPAIVFADADVDAAVEATGSFKFRNAGQVCIAPNRFFIHDDVYDQFVEKFSYRSERLIVGDGMDAHVQMGPMANARRMDVMRRFVDDASRMGARIVSGGTRIGNRGYFWKPTVLADVPDSAAVMTEEPFGPIAPMTPFREIEEVITRANALRYGLAAYVFTRSPRIAEILSDRLETGSVGINHLSPMPVDAPMGGVKESGYGYEGGLEGLEAFLQLKLITSAWS